jgi:lipopolysaccharide biosynthesis glycosyltransferase
VQLFDIKAVREEHIFKDALKFASEHPDKCIMVDQDALNVVLNGRWQVLDWRWNVMNPERYLIGPFYIRHHGGPQKPWSSDKSGCERAVIKAWRDDLAESPWPTKYQKDRHSAFQRAVRPVIRAVEEKLKSIYRPIPPEKIAERAFRRDLPRLLQQVEDAAHSGRLAKALN